MKISNLIFLSKLNLKGANRKKTVLVMMTLSVVAVILLTGYLSVYNRVLNTLRNNIEYRQILISPTIVYPELTLQGINETNIDEVRGMEHVESCEKQLYEEYQFTIIKKITDESGKDITDSSEEFSPDKINEGINEQQVDPVFSVVSVEGEQLKDAPVMSCIIPDYAYPFQEERFDTSMLLGKTLTIKTEYQFELYRSDGLGGYELHRDVTEPVTYDLKVVGIYRYAREDTYGGSDILVSSETAKKIEDMAVAEAQKDGIDMDDYVNDPYARNYVVTVDDEKNADAVSKILLDQQFHTMGYLPVDASITTFVNFFTGAGTFLLSAVLLLMIIILFLSVYSNINSRRGEIGLLKALGYKTSHIFKSMYLENVIQAVRALIIGMAISAIVSIIVNIVNSNSEILLEHSYVMTWQMFAVMSAIALAFILIVPLICQLIMLPRITKIQPQEAMNS